MLTSADFPQGAFGYEAGTTLISPRLRNGNRLPLFDVELKKITGASSCGVISSGGTSDTPVVRVVNLDTRTSR